MLKKKLTLCGNYKKCKLKSSCKRVISFKSTNCNMAFRDYANFYKEEKVCDYYVSKEVKKRKVDNYEDLFCDS